MPYTVYILANRRNGTLYTGFTRDLARRMFEHRTGAIPGFTAKHEVGRLVHYETYDDVNDALARERTLKRWRRAWKIALIEAGNPDWDDLYLTLNR